MRDPGDTAPDAVAAAVGRYSVGGPLLPRGLTRPPLASFGHGAAGIAYFLLSVWRLRGDRGALAAAVRWADVAEHAVPSYAAFIAPGRVFPDGRFPAEPSLYFGAAGVWCALALVAHASEDVERAERAVAGFAAISERCPAEAVDACNGAASLLLGAAALTEQLGSSVSGRLEPVGAALAARVESAVEIANSDPAALLGAAHGVAGMLHALLRWTQATGSPLAANVISTLDALQGDEVAFGQWPKRRGSQEIWSGWCHGSAGWAQLWTLAAQVTGDDERIAVAERAAAYAVYDGGGGAGLCCGRAGAAYAALAVYRATTDGAWLSQARRVAGEAASTSAGTEFPPDSLWRGDTGVALLLCELDEPAVAAMPLYRRT